VLPNWQKKGIEIANQSAKQTGINNLIYYICLSVNVYAPPSYAPENGECQTDWNQQYSFLICNSVPVLHSFEIYRFFKPNAKQTGINKLQKIL
jgi:hypothetical protein